MSERLRVRFTACSPFSSSPFSLFLCFLLALPPSFLLFLTHLLPLPLCPHMYTGAMGGADGGMGGGGASGAGGGGYGYYGNVPASMYGLLLGACRLGLEPLVYHTLKVTNMSKISGEQLQKAFTCSQEHGHQNLANCLKHLVRFTTFVTRYVYCKSRVRRT